MNISSRTPSRVHQAQNQSELLLSQILASMGIRFVSIACGLIYGHAPVHVGLDKTRGGALHAHFRVSGCLSVWTYCRMHGVVCRLR